MVKAGEEGPWTSMRRGRGSQPGPVSPRESSVSNAWKARANSRGLA